MRSGQNVLISDDDRNFIITCARATWFGASVNGRKKNVRGTRVGLREAQAMTTPAISGAGLFLQDQFSH